MVEQLRLIKSDEELRYIREAGQICSIAMRTAFEASGEGVNENDVAAATVAKLIEQGGEYAGLPPFLASGPRTTLVHATWAGRTMQKGDVIGFELPGVRARYCAALYRIGTIGEPTDEIRKGSDILIEHLQAQLAAIKAGKPTNEVHRRIQTPWYAGGAAAQRLCARGQLPTGLGRGPHHVVYRA